MKLKCHGNRSWFKVCDARPRSKQMAAFHPKARVVAGMLRARSRGRRRESEPLAPHSTCPAADAAEASSLAWSGRRAPGLKRRETEILLGRADCGSQPRRPGVTRPRPRGGGKTLVPGATVLPPAQLPEPPPGSPAPSKEPSPARRRSRTYESQRGSTAAAAAGRAGLRRAEN